MAPDISREAGGARVDAESAFKFEERPGPILGANQAF